MRDPNTEFRKRINKFIKENRSTFRNSPSRIISDFQGEDKLIKAYDGRQILEILQNADDAGATKVLIHLDQANHVLSFSNTGVPFSADGIGSLMIRDLSTKRGRKKMIGNKGLGFRSILNWANKITIISNKTQIIFSPDIAKEEFYTILSNAEERENLLTDHQYPKDTAPFPFLGIPMVSAKDTDLSKWDTEIIVDYKKEFSDKIIAQLKDFKKEILLFLNHIEELSIITNKESQVYESKKNFLYEKNSHDKPILINEVSIEDKTWQTFSLTMVLPDKFQDKNKLNKEYFNVCVAINKELNDDYFKLFTFFPTQLSIYLPCLIHGTFELDQARNYLTTEERNTFHFEQLVFLLSFGAQALAVESVDWRPYRLLSPIKTDSDDDKIKVFYQSIIKAKEKLAIFPCLDNNYRELTKGAYYGHQFSKFLLKNNLDKFFPNVYSPLPDSLLFDPYIDQRSCRLSADSLEKNIAKMSLAIKSNRTLAELVSILIDPSFKKIGKPRYSILLNKERRQIPADQTAFTPVTKSKEFNRPFYVNFDFINRSLYDELVQVFNLKSSTHPARDVQSKLKDYFNIQTYEPAQVIISYINKAKDTVEMSKTALSKKVIKEMVNALFIVYKSLYDENFPENNRVDETISGGVPLLAKSGKIINNANLVFGKEYPDGKLTDEIFKGIYSSDNYLAPVSIYGLEAEDIYDIQRFFQWLKVGSYSQLENWQETGNDYHQEPYIKYIYNSQSKPELRTSIHAKGIRIKGLDKILAQIDRGITREQILVWIIKDTKVNLALNYTKDKFYYSYGGRDMLITPKVNYIKWQFIKSGVFENYVIEERYLDIVNPYQINFQHPIFKTNDIQKFDIEKTLLSVGANQSFDELPVPVVFKILDKLKTDDKEKTGKHTNTLYKLALKNFADPKNRLLAIKHAKPYLFAKRGAERDYKPASEVYYADNHTLPIKVIEGLWLLNYPKRNGEVQIRDFLGTKTFEKLKPRIIPSGIKINQNLQNGLNQLMSEARIYILAFRIENIKNSDDKQIAADHLEEMEIILVDECIYTVDDDQRQYLGVGEFIHDDDKKYYFCVPPACNTMQKLKELTAFRDAFSEMFCVLFKVTELKTNFRNIIAIGLKDTRHILETEHESWILPEAIELIQVNIGEMNFWKQIFGFLNIDYPAKRGSRDKFIDDLKKVLKINLPIAYKKIDFENFADESSVDFLRYISKKLNVPINNCFPTGLYSFHYEWFRHYFDNYEKICEYKLWRSLEADIKTQKLFLKKRDKYQILKNDFSKKNAKIFQYKLGLQYDKMVRHAIAEVFQILITINEEASQIISELYKSLRDKYYEEWYGLPIDFQSLAFYPGHRDRIKNELLKIKDRSDGPEEEAQDEATRTEQTVSNPEKPTLNFVTLTKVQSPVHVPVAHHQGRSVFDVRINKHYYHAGKEAEKMVRNLLVDIYGRENVKWVSGYSDEPYRDDLLGYDIKYRENSKSKWILVEVKSASGDAFIISSFEVSVGIANKNSYYLALLKDNKVSIVKDFFVDDGWTKEFIVESNYTAVPKDWFVSFITSHSS